MLLIAITLLLIAVGVIAYCVGAWQLSRYAARVSGGLGVAVLLFPPVAFWFAFFKLQHDGKEMPITLWLFGMISTVILAGVFWGPLMMAADGRISELDPAPAVPTPVAIVETSKPAEEPTPPAEPAAAEPVANATNNLAAGTQGAAATATNNVAAGTNAGAAAPAN